MGDAMDGVMHGQRPIATPRTRKVTVKKTAKRKSAGGSGQSSSTASANQTPSKRVKVAAISPAKEEESWSVIAQNHTALLQSHAHFLATLLSKSQPSSARTPALVGFLSRTHELLAQVKTLEALSPSIPSSPTKPAPNSSAPRQTTPPPRETKARKMDGLSEELQSVVLDNKKRTRSPSPVPSPQKLEDRQESPMKKINSAPDTPVGAVKSSLKAKAGIRSVGAQFAQAQVPRTPTVVTASTSAASSTFASVRQEKGNGVGTEGDVEVNEEGEVSLMDPDDFAAEVAARLRAKERRKHKIVEGSKGKRRRRSSTVDGEERRREKRVKRESLSGGPTPTGGDGSFPKQRRRISGVLRSGDADADGEGRGRV